MPPLKAPAPGSPEDWLRLAKADWVLACVPLPEGGLYRTLCFHAQQSVEKCIKAVIELAETVLQWATEAIGTYPAENKSS